MPKRLNIRVPATLHAALSAAVADGEAASLTALVVDILHRWSDHYTSTARGLIQVRAPTNEQFECVRCYTKFNGTHFIAVSYAPLRMSGPLCPACARKMNHQK